MNFVKNNNEQWISEQVIDETLVRDEIMSGEQVAALEAVYADKTQDINVETLIEFRIMDASYADGEVSFEKGLINYREGFEHKQKRF